MPIYEYSCAQCGQAQELLEPMSAPASHDCPACGREAGMRRQLSTAAIAIGGATPAPRPASGGGCASCPYAS